MRAMLLLLAMLSLLASPSRAADRETVLFDFGTHDGAFPFGGLVADQSGNLYGVTGYTYTDQYGDEGGGTVFELSPPQPGQTGWTRTVIHKFNRTTEGEFPASLIMARGKLYGVLRIGFTPFGSIFELTPPAPGGTAWSINGITPSASYTPVTALTADATGALYSPTLAYGSTTCGAVLKTVPPSSGQTGWTQTVLFVFPQGECQPDTAPVLDAAGALFGTTAGCCNGDPQQTDFGGIYKLAPPTRAGGAWRQTVLYRFSPVYKNDRSPSLFLAGDGALYGTTTYGGDTSLHDGFGYGQLFRLQPAPGGGAPWILNQLYAFQGNADGAYPYGLCGDAKTGFYAAASQTGGSQDSLIVKFVPPASGSTGWTEKVLHTFIGLRRGQIPNAPLLRGPGRRLYGTTAVGGTRKAGVAFELAY